MRRKISGPAILAHSTGGSLLAGTAIRLAATSAPNAVASRACVQPDYPLHG